MVVLWPEVSTRGTLRTVDSLGCSDFTTALATPFTRFACSGACHPTLRSNQCNLVASPPRHRTDVWATQISMARSVSEGKPSILLSLGDRRTHHALHSRSFVQGRAPPISLCNTRTPGQAPALRNTGTPTNRSSWFSHACPKRQAWHTSSAPKSCGSNKLEKPFFTTDRTGTGGNVDRPGCGGWIAVQRGESVSAPMPAACRSENRRYAPTRPRRPLPSK